MNLPEGVVMRRTGDGRAAPSTDLSAYQEVRPGDLVMNQLGKPHGALGVSGFHGIISPAYFIAELSDRIHPRFAHHLLRTRLYISEYERRGKFMPPSQFDISWDQFREIDLALPPPEVQRAIADYLDAETARIDALITKKRRMIDLLGEQVDAQVFAAVSGSLTAGSTPRKHTQIPWLDTIPSHWGSPWLGANHTTQLGKMLSASVASGPEQYPYVKNTNVQWDRFDLTDLPTMTFDASDRVRCNLDEGDLLVCEGGEVGRAAVWPGAPKDVFFQKAIHRVRPVSEAEPRYTMYCLWAAANMNVFAVEGNQATIVHLTGEKLREHRFPWPPLAEQREIVRHLDQSRAKVEGMVERLTKQIDLLAERRQALITAAVTGELEIPGVAA
ncbi:restriction endonuclease subunit S [Candidatus Microthrix parvicella]|uniref:restriction endonuclease subunit S n=1 Tax=Candidatus Neomicrothrix parvicella TaxID=41950 RepID=UPI0012FE1C2C|nr:restriction endonuclease subunit S [Candidatus Microthrix parvicella]